MTAGGPGEGGHEPGGASLRRGNGLVAERWSALAAIEPATSDDVLAALAGRGVAGLVESPGRPGAELPSGADGPAGRAAPGTPAPGERALLWVDAGLRDEAEALLVAEFAGRVTVLPVDPAGPPGTATPAAPRSPAPAGSGPAGPGGGVGAGGGRPGGGALDEDAAWAQIVASWDREDGAPVPPWPVDEDVADPRGRETGDRSSVVRPARPAEATPPAGGPRDHAVAGDPRDEHYVPPPPPPLPRLRRNTVAALAVLALGIVLLFAPRLVGVGGGDAVAVTGIACIVGSVAALVHGMRDRGSRDGWDDGAVV